MSSVSFLGDFSQIADFQGALNFSDLLLPILAFLFSYLIAYALITVAALAYIKSYIDNKGVVNYEEVQNSTKEKFWPYVGLFFLNGIIVFFGALFCFLPGIYFGIVLSLSICLLIFQNKSVTDAINDSFGFIKGHWWETFGVLIVVQLIIIFISFILDLPATLYQAADITSIIQGDASNEILKSFSDPIYLMLIALSYFIKFILYMVATVATVFIYYDIKEQKDPSKEIIDEIGVE
jgi:hypothetical protein